MAQSSVFPIRFGLQVPRGENLQSTEILCEGGLDLTQQILETRPGFAAALTNYEVSLIGGYRRISGFTKFSTTVVPGQGQLLGVIVSPAGYVLAARQDASDATKYNVYTGTGTTWTRINPTTTTQTGTTHTNTTIDGLASTVGLVIGQPVSGTGIPVGARIAAIPSGVSITLTAAATNSATETITFSNPLTFSSGMVVTNCYYNWIGTIVVALTDGVNYSYTWDGTTFVILSAVGAATNPKFCTEFMGYYFVGGYSTNFGAIKISAPLNAADWNALDGAAEIVIGDTITFLKPWRQQLIIFCKNSIYRMVGNSTNPASSSPFQIQQITDRIGCVEGRTVKEINGDLIYLATDGLRTIAGTFKIGDTEIGSISRPIQSIVSAINTISTQLHSCVVSKKTQYRLFYNNSAQADAASYGVLASIRRFRDGHEDWEFAQLQGIRPACADSEYWTTTNQEYVVHGGYDGFVYRQEQGGTFSGTAITSNYTTVPLEFGDRAIRKVLHRITLYVTVDTAAPQIYLRPVYDLNSIRTLQPNAIILTNVGGGDASLWDSGAVWDGGAAIVWDSSGAPLFRQSITGSGFVAQIQFTEAASNSPFTIQGMEIEYFPAGRR